MVEINILTKAENANNCNQHEVHTHRLNQLRGSYNRNIISVFAKPPM